MWKRTLLEAIVFSGYLGSCDCFNRVSFVVLVICSEYFFFSEIVSMVLKDFT